MGKKRLLITGATGFIGTWTQRHWRKIHPAVEIWATSHRGACSDPSVDHFHLLDLFDANAVEDYVSECHPNQVIHLAGLTQHGPLMDHLVANVQATENLYTALAGLHNAREIRVVQAGSAAIYGQVQPDKLPVNESDPFRPLTSYALSKLMQDYLAQMVWDIKGLGVIRARIFNLLGPGQPAHLIPAEFIQQVKSMSDGDSLVVGNLGTRRDFIDVRDVPEAFDKLLTKGCPGKAYNIASGTSIAIRDILETLISFSGFKDIELKQIIRSEQKKDIPDIFASCTEIYEQTGWQPKIQLRQSLEDMWNANVEANRY